MIDLVIVFLVLALVAGSLGFFKVEVISIEMAKMLFIVFLALFLVSAVMKVLKGRRP